LKLSAGTGKRGHDRANGYGSNDGNLLARTPFQLAQDDYLARA